MRAVVVNVAAETGGALSVLRGFHASVAHAAEHEWSFMVSTPDLRSSPTTSVLRFPWVKKTFLHRLWFDFVKAPRLIRAMNPDVVLSLQNVTLPRVSMPQIVYLHQALPFSDFAFDPRRSVKMWLYQQLVSRRILHSLRGASLIVVQSDWMKDAVVRTTNVLPRRVVVVRPSVPRSGPARYEDGPSNRRRFFYPASDIEYKNHAVILAAVSHLHGLGLEDFEVSLTLPPESSRYGRHAARRSIRFRGRMDYDAVQQEYARSVLIFPSVLETVGFPLLEAKRAGTFIIAADLPYAREALGEYPNALYFPPTDPRILATHMASIMNEHVPYQHSSASLDEDATSWSRLVELVAASCHE